MNSSYYQRSNAEDSYGIKALDSNAYIERLNRKGWFIANIHEDSLIDSILKKCINSYELFLKNNFQIRAPLVNNPDFLRLTLNASYVDLVQRIDKDCYLNQQNLLAIFPSSTGHKDQSRWHRDIPYQKWIPNQLAIFNILLCIGEIKDNSYHSLDILEGSHQHLDFPEYFSNDDIKNIHLKPGELLVMNSFLYHRAPTLISKPFYLVNTVFTPRCFKQQVILKDHFNPSSQQSLSQSAKQFLGIEEKMYLPDIF